MISFICERANFLVNICQSLLYVSIYNLVPISLSILIDFCDYNKKKTATVQNRSSGRDLVQVTM